jgi:hypothetical protein
MARILGIHRLTLNPGVSPEAFERFLGEEWKAPSIFPGWQFSVARADRGEGAGQYAAIIEIESVAARDRYAPASGQPSEEDRQAGGAALRKEAEQWARYASSPGGPPYTDWVVIAE